MLRSPDGLFSCLCVPGCKLINVETRRREQEVFLHVLLRDPEDEDGLLVFFSASAASLLALGGPSEMN